jgi:hypothetical protein
MSNDHIPDVTKMISDTPRTDAAEYESQDEPAAKLGAVDVEFARQLERELNIAQERIKRLQEALDNTTKVAASRINQLENGGNEAIYKTNLFDREWCWNRAKEAKP